MSVRIRVRMSTAALAMTVALVGALAGCTEANTSQGPGGDVPYVAPSVNAAAASKGIERSEADAEAAASAEAYAELQAAVEGAAKRPADVRDAFAGLQATYQDGCAPGGANCAYFLGRVNDELTSLERSMKADNDGPNHFKEPMGWISGLRTTLAGDTSTDNLEKHRKQLIGTRDRINVWMQGHPEDYR
ncbi:hypothetical protein ACIOEW_00680 [Streptomyces sp. NPDC087901]|uniref:hypothetical protein n=1 Tax=Streptomyces sp. NPDC087901 TaxID=3365818 RepID=UPI00380D5633